MSTSATPSPTLGQLVRAARQGPRPQAEATVVRTVKFSDRTYQKLSNGQLLRDDPQRPWRGKAERRRVIAQRRLDRA